MPALRDTALVRRNALLAALPPASLRRVLARAGFAPVKTGEVLYAPETTIRQAHFPIEGIISILIPGANECDVEVALVGAEGLVGLPLVCGVNTTCTTAIVRAPGFAVVLAAHSCKRELEQNRPFARVLHAYACAFLSATARGAACAILHGLEQRCARWLLMARDRLGTDSFPLTHEALAHALGVRRASVTVTVAKLRREGAIAFTRGQVTISDHKRVEQIACACYRKIRSEYDPPR